MIAALARPLFPCLVAMNRKVCVVLLMLAWLMPANALALKVVATISDVAVIAREVVGADGKVITLANSNQDPHYVDPRPSLLVDMSRADALVLVGLDLETGWLPVLLKGARNASIQLGAPGYIDTSVFIEPMEVPTVPVDRSMGDVHPRGNPHYLKDPGNAVRVAHGLALRLGALDPAHAAAFKSRADAFAQSMEKRIKEWTTRLAFLKGQGVVTYHTSLNYMIHWLGLVPVGHIEPKPGVPPTPSHLAGLISLARTQKVRLFLAEQWFPVSTASVVAEKSGARLTVVPGLPAENQSFAAHMEEIVALLERAAKP